MSVVVIYIGLGDSSYNFKSVSYMCQYVSLFVFIVNRVIRLFELSGPIGRFLFIFHNKKNKNIIYE
jgi:hypothetical protein